VPWVKLSDDFCVDPRIVKAGNEIAGVYARMYSYSGRADGEVPSAMALAFAQGDIALLDTLRQIGLIEPRGDDWYLPGWKTARNLTAAQWAERQEKDRQRQEKKRKRDNTRESRRDTGKADG